MLGESVIEGLEICHPLLSKTAVNDVHFVEQNKEWCLALVEDGQRVHHVTDESVGVLATDGVCHIEGDGWERAREGLRDDLPGCRLGEGLDLPRRVYDHVINLVALRRDQVDDLIELGGEEVQASENSTVRAELVRLHHFLVLDRVSYINVARVRNFEHGGIQVDIVGLFAVLAQV